MAPVEKRQRQRVLRKLEKALTTRALKEVLEQRVAADAGFKPKLFARSLIICTAEHCFPSQPNILSTGTPEDMENTVRTLSATLRPNLKCIRSLITEKAELTAASAFAATTLVPPRVLSKTEEDRIYRVIYLDDLKNGAVMLSNEKLFGKGSNSGVKY